MNDLDDFLTLLHDELGLRVTPEDTDRALTELTGWDSLHLLRLVTALEARTGRSISVIDLFEAPDLRRIYQLTTT
ncbi:acyl carrier protein [Streptomyces sp. NPDC002454]|uniref:acyl carrier protein n=1 Tax=unclassified Streptomyces TaxID=2593676 RepID=UPI0033205406